jgi:hypothetical protein
MQFGFTFAAPVLVQEKHQAHVDMVHTPKVMITILKKHNIYYKTMVNQACSSETEQACSEMGPGCMILGRSKGTCMCERGQKYDL